jgi:hypothetical protein
MQEREGNKSPLLDLCDAVVKELIQTASKCGYITRSQITERFIS